MLLPLKGENAFRIPMIATAVPNNELADYSDT
jgi:hypothetical protein